MKTFCLVLLFIASGCFADSEKNLYNVNEADSYGYLFITNTLAKDVYLVAANERNKYNYSKFNCFIPIPKQYQTVAPSPSFQTIEFKNYSAEGVMIQKRQTVVYAINTICDDKKVDNLKDHFALAPTDGSSESILYYRDFYIDELNHTFGGYIAVASNPILLGAIPTRTIQMSIVLLPKMQ